MLPPALKHKIEVELSLKIEHASRISGGSINDVARVDTNAGILVVKWNHKMGIDFFEAEKQGLQTLSKAQTELVIPEVRLIGEVHHFAFIVMEFLHEEADSNESERSLGRGLAHLHTFSNQHFGWHNPNFIGSLPQKNDWHESGYAFFENCRLRPLFDKARERHLLHAEEQRQFERLCKRLPQLLPNEKPALLHGDLWGGNKMSLSNGKAALFDPAVYYGFREIDLAMTKLFGGFANSFMAAYEEIFPLAPNFEQRLPIYHLYPLLVHVLLFGAGYTEQVRAILSRF